MSEVLGAATTALKATAELLFIICIGFLLARHGMLDADARRTFSKFSLVCSYPLLALSAGRDYDLAAFSRYAGTLLCASTLHIAGGFCLATAAARLLRVPRQERAYLQLMGAFCNNFTLPFLLSSAVASTWKHTRAEPDAVGRAYAIVIIYSLPWMLLVLTLGRNAMLAERVGADGLTAGQARRSDELDAAESAPKEAATPVATPERAPGSRSPGSRASRAVAAARAFASRNPAVPAEALSVCIACIEPVRRLLFYGAFDWVGRSCRIVGQITPPMGALVMAGALRASLAAEGCASYSQRRRAVLLTIGIKLVLMPVLSYAVTLGAVRLGLLERDPLLLLVILLQSAMPSGMTLISVAAVEMPPRWTGRLAALYLPQYLFATFSLTVAVGAALLLIDGIVGEAGPRGAP